MPVPVVHLLLYRAITKSINPSALILFAQSYVLLLPSKKKKQDGSVMHVVGCELQQKSFENFAHISITRIEFEKQISRFSTFHSIIKMITNESYAGDSAKSDLQQNANIGT